MISRSKNYIKNYAVKLNEIYNSGETSNHLIKTFILYGLIALSIIITKVLIARLYGQIELGIFSYFFSVVTIAFLFTSLCFPEAITQTVIKNPSKLKSALWKAIAFIIPITALVVLPFITLKVFAAPSLKTSFVLYIIAFTFFYLVYSILRGYKKFLECSFYSMINRAVFILFIILFAFMAWGFNLLLASMSLALVIAGIAGLPKAIKLWKSTPQTEKVETKEFFYLAVSLFLMQAGFYLLRETDTILIPYLAGFEQQAIYSAQSSISNVIRLIAYVFPVVVLPMAAVNKYKLKRSLIKILKLLLPFSALVLILNYISVPLLYGPQYRNLWLPITLMISSILLVVYSYFNSILVGENTFSKFYFKIISLDFLITLVVNTGLIILFVSEWGILGAPIAVAITVVLKIILNVFGIKKLREQKDKGQRPGNQE